MKQQKQEQAVLHKQLAYLHVLCCAVLCYAVRGFALLGKLPLHPLLFWCNLILFHINTNYETTETRTSCSAKTNGGIPACAVL
jgi:hypothetical protein